MQLYEKTNNTMESGDHSKNEESLKSFHASMDSQKIRDSIIDGSFDLGSATRDGLQFVLKTAYEEIRPYLRCEQSIKNKNDEIITAEDKLHRKLGCFGLSIFIGLLLLFFAFWGGLSGEDKPLALFLFFFLVSLFYYISQRKVSGNIKNLKTDLLDLKREQECIMENFLLLLLIPYKYRSQHIISKMLEYIQNKEASTWEHCADLYKTEIDRSEQLKLDQQTAEESARQREMEEKQLRTQRATAIASIILTAGILRINSIEESLTKE